MTNYIKFFAIFLLFISTAVKANPIIAARTAILVDYQ